MTVPVQIQKPVSKALKFLAMLEDKTVKQYIHDRLVEDIEDNLDELPDQILDMLEMGRKRPQSKKKFEALQDQIGIHLLKLFVYPESGSVRGWLKELNAWKDTLFLHNVTKESKTKNNFNKAKVSDFIWDGNFGNFDNDIEARLIILTNKVFPQVVQSSIKEKDLKKMVDIYIDRIMDGKDFKV